MWLLAGLASVLGCSHPRVGQAAGAPSEDAVSEGAVSNRELIPAEWTIAEDTSVTGDITTTSLQLPAAKEISGLLDDESPRLVLRCFDGKVEAFIDNQPSGSDSEPDSGSTLQPVRIQLDSAPSCE
jgi:hypothetical protein